MGRIADLWDLSGSLASITRVYDTYIELVYGVLNQVKQWQFKGAKDGFCLILTQFGRTYRKSL